MRIAKNEMNGVRTNDAVVASIAADSIWFIAVCWINLRSIPRLIPAMKSNECSNEFYIITVWTYLPEQDI